jgi:hypothetical protein
MGKFLKPKQFNLAHYSKGVRHLKLLKDGFGDGRFGIGCDSLALEVNLHLLTVRQLNGLLKLCEAIAVGEYTDI